MNEEKWKLFLEVARTLNCRGATPLLYGSLGLWHRTGEAIFADDIDVLLPETWLSEQWSAFQTLLQAEDWRLIDAHEHTFEKTWRALLLCRARGARDLRRSSDF